MQDIIYLCPATPRGSCDWEGHESDLVPHFEDRHREYFLDTNSLDIDIRHDNETHYLMTLYNETFLIQTRYTSSAGTVELKVRYLGGESRASNMCYYIDIVCGNFGFTSRDTGNSYETITNKDGVIYIDVQTIKVTCGRNLLDTLVTWIHIDNECSQYMYKSIKRRQYDKKTSESKTRESFKRLSSYRTSMRKKSMDGIECVQALDKSIKQKWSTSMIETPEIYEEFIDEIVDEIFRDAMDVIDDFEWLNAPVEDQSNFPNNHDKTDTRTEEVITDIVEYTPPSDFLESIKKKSQNSFNGDPAFEDGSTRRDDSHVFHITTNCDATQYEEVKVFKSYKDIRIEISLPCFKEDVVSSVEVATHQVANVEYIEDVEDLQSCEWLLNGYEMENKKEEKSQNNDGLSEAEESFLNNINRIKCQNCHIIMIPPIFMCSDGHSVCSTCKTLNCGICGIEVTDIRNIDLEEISRSIAHPCRFAEKGCSEMQSCYEIRRHEVYCDHFNYKCPILPCLYIGRCFDMKSHLKLLHPSVKVVEATQHCFARNSEFILANKYGIFHCTAPLKVNSIEWTVSFCGLEKISFACRVKVAGKKGGKIYNLQRHGNGYKSAIFLDELKSLRLKDKHAILELYDY